VSHERLEKGPANTEEGVPHISVPDNELYKHISIEIPEAIRARHLMVWCAKRAAESHLEPSSSKSKGKGKDKSGETIRTVEGDKLIASIMEEFAGNLGKGLIDTNVFANEVGRNVQGSTRGADARLK
jgi:kinetochore protein Mis13/DSN1